MAARHGFCLLGAKEKEWRARDFGAAPKTHVSVNDVYRNTEVGSQMLWNVMSWVRCVLLKIG